MSEKTIFKGDLISVEFVGPTLTHKNGSVILGVRVEGGRWGPGPVTVIVGDPFMVAADQAFEEPKKGSNFIAYRRGLKSMSQADLAQAAGCHWTTISRLEREEMEVTKGWLVRLASVLDCTPADLIGAA